jgi:hypothetical protein
MLGYLCSPSGQGFIEPETMPDEFARAVTLRGSLIVVAGLLLAFMMPAAPGVHDACSCPGSAR